MFAILCVLGLHKIVFCLEPSTLIIFLKKEAKMIIQLKIKLSWRRISNHLYNENI